MPATPSLKLTYFDVDARATAIRKTLTMASVPFVDERVSRDQFKELKPTLPYGKVPVLDVDGQVVAETQAILRYVGRLAGMYPSDALAAAMIDEIIDSFDDLFERLFMASFVETDADKKKQMRAALVNGPLPHALALLDNRLAEILKYPYFQQTPSKVSLLDVVAWDFVKFMRSGLVDHIPTTFIDAYKTMVGMFDKVEANPSVNQREGSASPTTPPPSPPKRLKLTYFDKPGCAEPIRLALRIGGVAFEDERIALQDVAQRKHALPNEQVPVFQVDGQFVIAQSVAILRYVGKFTGLYPTQDAMLALRIDEVLSHIGELYFAVDPSFRESDPVKKKLMLAQFANETIPESLAGLEKRLAQWKKNALSAYAMGGETPTIADLAICNFVMFLQSGVLDDVPTTIVDDYDNIGKASEAVAHHPRVQQWSAEMTSQPFA